MNILIVDPNLGTRLILENMLADYGTCTTAEECDEAMEEFKAELGGAGRYHLLLTDITLESADGGNILTKVREIEEERQVASFNRISMIVLSSNRDITAVSSILTVAKPAAYLLKPVLGARLHSEMANLGFPRNQVARDLFPFKNMADLLKKKADHS